MGLFLFFNKVSSCQNIITENSNYKVVYNLNYQKDSTDISTKTDEKMVLLISDEYSLFESKAGRHNDSIAVALENSGVDIYTAMEKMKANRKKNRFNFRILKDKNKTLIYNSLFSDNFLYENKEDLQWELLDDSQIINGYNCNLATVKYAGRIYNAWFTNEIPIPDGPYIFNGLPGLIVMIKDKKEEYIFELISFQNENDVFKFDLDKGTKLSKEDYFKVYNSFKKNFIAQLSQKGIDVASNDKRSLKRRVQKSRNNAIEIKY